jgi:N-acetylmuramoyl-L-alanine amidase
MKIAVDPGHGNSNRNKGVYDPGAEHLSGGVKYQEADIALRYGLALKDVLRARAVSVFMTRENATDDAPVGERAGNAERAGCDMFVSLHLNDNESEAANGLEVLYRDSRYKPLAKVMHDALIKTTGFKPRGPKQRLDLAVLKFEGPAVLIELGFISNDRDRTELLNPQVRAAICETIADVVQQQAQPAMASAAALDAVPAGIATSYTLPSYALDALGPDSGVPWKNAKALAGMNFYSGVVANSFHQFPAAVLYEGKFAIDNDGAGGNEDGDVHHQGDTSLHDAGDKALDARSLPYIVLPLPNNNPNRPKWSDLGVALGDLGVCFYRSNRSCAVIYGDSGPPLKLGEGSMQAARQLGINPDPNVGGIGPNEVPPGVVHVVFPQSRNLLSKGASGRPRTADTIETIRDRAWALLKQFKNGASAPAVAVMPAAGSNSGPAARWSKRKSK